MGYITFSSNSNFTLKTNNNKKTGNGTMYYSTDASTGTTGTGTTTISSKNKKLYMKGSKNSQVSNGTSGVLSGSNISCSGNIANLVDADAVDSQGYLNMADYCFRRMFAENTSLISAPTLSFNRYLTKQCCDSMFLNCINLTTVPTISADSMREKSFYQAFKGCTKLPRAPRINIEFISDGGCAYMFENCTSMTSSPDLNFTSVREHSMHGMFKGCVSLKSTPSIKSVSGGVSVCQSMFEGCTSLTQATALPDTSVSWNAYAAMFRGCTSLQYPPVINLQTANSGVCSYMFAGCTSLLETPVLKATELSSECYAHMFEGCISLQKAYDLPSNCKLANTSNAFAYMFSGCSALTIAPQLYGVYGDQCQYMFYNCTNLMLAPNVISNEPGKGFDHMFDGCTNLKTVFAFNKPSYIRNPTCGVGGMFANSGVRLSTVQTEEYSNPYIITGDYTDTGNFTDMFLDVNGNPFTPLANVTYYTNAIVTQGVRELSYHVKYMSDDTLLAEVKPQEKGIIKCQDKSIRYNIVVEPHYEIIV